MSSLQFYVTYPTPGERLWLQRKMAKRTLRQEARRIGVNHNYYSEMERDRRDPPAHVAASLPFPTAYAGPFALQLMRRRAGVRLPELAKRLGVTRLTILKWERAADPRLVEFWTKDGLWLKKKERLACKR